MPNRLSDSINIGVADIFFTPDKTGFPIYLGLTKGGVSLKYETNWHEITSDQTGSTPLDDIMIGESVTVEAKVLDTSKNKLAAIIPAVTAAGGADDPEAVTFGQRPGLRATHHAGSLRLHPISMGNDVSNDVIIYRTTNSGDLELAFKLDEEWVIPCKFKGYYDDKRKPGDQLFRIGADAQDNGEYKRVIQFWITPSNPVVNIGETIQFQANAMFEDGSTEDITDKCTWITSDPATVSLSGTDVITATAHAAGSVGIRADYIGYSNSTAMVVE